MNKEPMIKNKFRLSLKLFIMVWIALFVHVLLKLTFNYWQPYVMPNEQLQIISNFIDNNRWIRDILDGILYVFNGVIMILAGIRCWWFKSKKETLLTIGTIVVCFLLNIFFNFYNFTPIITTIILPLVIDKRKWLSIIITFLLNNLFILLSLFLEGFVNANYMPCIIQTFLVLDYYIMLVLNYFVFNLIKRKELKE